jgi:very-short-patch-repair endonuclease
MLWSRLRRLRDRGYRVRRQFPFRGYFLDFVCLSLRLVIEVDRYQHGEDRQADHDIVRDRILQDEGFLVLRFATGEVKRNLNGVMDHILGALEGQISTRDGREPAGSEPEPDFPTLATSSPVPPH